MSGDGFRVVTLKIEKAQSWPRTTFPNDIRSFLGLSDYYRRLVEGLSFSFIPFDQWNLKTIKFQWSEACEKSFQELKKRLTTTQF